MMSDINQLKLIDKRTGKRETMENLRKDHSLERLCEMVATGDFEIIDDEYSPRPSNSDLAAAED